MNDVRVAVAVASTHTRADYLNRTLLATEDHYGWIDPIVDHAHGATPNLLAAWQHLAQQNASHALLLHDDLNASYGWRDAVTALASTFPRQQVMSLFTQRPRSLARPWDLQPGHVRLSIRLWRDDQAVLMPVPVVRRYLGWVKSKQYRPHISPQQFLNHATLLATFHREAGGKVIYLADPPVFQHMGNRHQQAPNWRGRAFDAGAYYRHTLVTGYNA